jgi:mannitol/fructose-specific phosphotransferase system IIA component (Ntr-type)
MRFVERLRPELIRIDPPWSTFAETIEGLVAVLAHGGRLGDVAPAAAAEAIAAREAEASTALLDVGAGVPHARLPGLVTAASALAVAERGLYEAVPTVRIKIVALVLSPPAAAADHLAILAGVGTLLRSAALRGALLVAEDGAEALAALRRHARSTP